MAEQQDLFPDSVRQTPASQLDSRISYAIAEWLLDRSMQSLAMLKHVVDQRVALEHGMPR